MSFAYFVTLLPSNWSPGPYTSCEVPTGSPEGCAAFHTNGPIVTEEKEKVNLGELQEWTAWLGVAASHHLNVNYREIWGSSPKEKKDILNQKEEYKRARTEEIETRKKLAEEVESIMSERARYERERETREQQQQERERCHLEKQRLLEQELAKLKLELQQKDCELQTRLEQKGEENYGSLARRLDDVHSHLDAPTSSDQTVGF